MFRWRSSSKENKDKPREHDASAMDIVTGQNIPLKSFNPFQELQPLMQLVTELHERSGPAMDALHRCCKDNQEKEDKIGMQAKEIHALTDLAAEKELQINQLQELLRQKEVEMEAFQLQAQEVERNLREEHSALEEQKDRDMLEKWKLDEELKALSVQTSRLSEDLRAREEQVKSLLQQLKEEEGMQKKAAFLVSRVQSLLEDVKAKELKYKEADGKHQMQLSINGKLCNEKSELQATSAQLSVNLAQAKEAILAVASERDTLRTAVQEHEAEEESLKVQLQECNRKMSELKQVCDAQVRALQGEMMQLMGSLESRNAEYSAVVAEKEGLTTENQQLKANEEGLHCLLREKRKENTELQQAYDRQCQRLRNVAAYAEDAVDTPGHCAKQPVRYNLRPRHKTQESATTSGVFSMGASGPSTEPFLSTSLHQNLHGVPQLPAESLPDVSTDFLMPYLKRISGQWYELAHSLGVDDVAENLKQTEQDSMRKCLQCLQAWIERGPEVDCSWEKLLRVLNILQLHAVAQEIQCELWRRAFTNSP